MNVMVSLSNTPHGPSAALESVPAVLIRRAAVSLHHSIDGDLGHGRQLHARGSFTVAPPLVGGLTPTTNSTAPIRHPLPRKRNLRQRASAAGFGIGSWRGQRGRGARRSQ